MSQYDEEDCCCGGLLASNDVRTAIISGGTFKNRSVQYAAVDGLAVFEGCIILGTVDEVEAKTAQAKAAFDAGDDPEDGPVTTCAENGKIDIPRTINNSTIL